MNPEKAAMLDIARRKEIFAYESTEVLLKLKGDFAAFSGENTRFAESAVAEERLVIPSVRIPGAAPVAIRVGLPAGGPAAVFVPFAVKRAAPPAKLTEVGKPALARPVCLERQPVSIRLPSLVRPAVKALRPPVRERPAVSVPALPRVERPRVAPVSAASVSVAVPELPVPKAVRLPVSAPRPFETPVPKAAPPAVKGRIPAPHVGPVTLSLPSLAPPKPGKAAAIIRKKAVLPAIPDTRPVPRPRIPAALAAPVPPRLRLPPTGDAAWKREKPQLLPAAAAAGPIRAWDIPVPDFKTAAAAAKPPARKPLRLPELPDLSVPAPPEIRI